MSILNIVLIIIIAYLLGSIPNAYIVTRLVKGINIFNVGSGNMGGTNVARTLGLGWGIFSACLDILKGVIAVLIAQMIIPASDSLVPSICAALAAVAGHNWSLFATLLYAFYRKQWQLRGGKGAATAFGTMLVLIPWWLIALLLTIGISLAFLTRYASLSVLVSYAITLIIFSAMVIIQPERPNTYLAYTLLLAVLIAWRFRENIERLLSGTERKLGERVDLGASG